MPLYEYKCQKCGENVEAIQRIADPPFTICPHCGGELKKLISAPAIQFKGSGFHITDYPKTGSGSKSEAKEGSTKSEAKEGSTEKSESKTSKPETSSGDKPEKKSDDKSAKKSDDKSAKKSSD